MPLIKNGSLVEDSYVRVLGADPAPGRGPFIVAFDRWIRDRADLLEQAAARPVGVRVPNDADIEDLGADAGRLSLVVLEFPKFTDGRAYSQARILRDRLGFRGELRASGEVLRDQFLFMHRAGFDSFAVEGDRALDGWKAALAEFSVYYQPASDNAKPASALRHRRYGESVRRSCA